MTINPAAPVLALAVLALTPSALVIAQTTSSGIHGMTPVPTQEQQLEARVTTLEGEVTQLTAEIKALKTHTHQYFIPKGPSTYMSIHDLSLAMQPHSTTPTTQYYVPLMLSPGGQPGVGGIQSMTSGPMTPP